MNGKKLKQENQRLHHQLDRKNDYKMTDLIAYLRDQDLTAEAMEDLRHEMLTLALSAQENGKALETVFGYEPKAYVDGRVREIGPMDPREARSEAFRLWSRAFLFLTAFSILSDLFRESMTLGRGILTAGHWTLKVSDLAFLIMVAGVSVPLSGLFSRYRLEKDPDFFSSAGNRLGDFVRTYGTALLIVLAGAALLYLKGKVVLLALSYPMAFLLLLVLFLSCRWIQGRLKAGRSREIPRE